MTDEKLIELVREQPILYDKAQKGYSNINVKAKIWAAIAGKCVLQSGDEAKTTWIKLRDAYRSSLRRLETRSGDEVSPSKAVKWKFPQQMSFLKLFMKDRQRHTNENINSVDAIITEMDDVSRNTVSLSQNAADQQSESEQFQETSTPCSTASSQSTKI